MFFTHSGVRESWIQNTDKFAAKASQDSKTVALWICKSAPNDNLFDPNQLKSQFNSIPNDTCPKNQSWLIRKRHIPIPIPPLENERQATVLYFPVSNYYIKYILNNTWRVTLRTWLHPSHFRFPHTRKRWALCSSLQVFTLLYALCLVIRGKPRLCLNTISINRKIPQGAGSYTPRLVTALPALSADPDKTIALAPWDHFCTDHFLYRIIFKGPQAKKNLFSTITVKGGVSRNDCMLQNTIQHIRGSTAV